MYVVKKPVNIGGKRRAIGELVNLDEVKSGTLIRCGYVAKIDSGLLDVAEEGGAFKAQEGAIEINVPIIQKDGSMDLSVGLETVSEAFRLLQAAPNDAIETINGITDEDLLIILDACDSRKAVHAAVRARATALQEAAKNVEGEG